MASRRFVVRHFATLAMSDITDVQELGKAAAKVIGHEKFLRISPGAAVLWLRGLVLLTTGQGAMGGMIPDHALHRKYADELVTAGLWRRDEGGWRMRRLTAEAPPAPPPPPPPVVGTEVLRFATVNSAPGYWVLTQEQITEWQAVYSAVDVLEECRKANAWIDAKPTRRKTVRGMRAFLVTWLSRAHDQQHRVPRDLPKVHAGRTGPAPPGKYDHLVISDETLAEEEKK
jgi:hypothetical protein